MNNKYKNICRYCGGKLVIEYFGSYGTIYPLKRNGREGKRRIKRILYEESDGDYMIFCQSCGKAQEVEQERKHREVLT